MKGPKLWRMDSIKEWDLGQLENHMERNRLASTEPVYPANAMATSSPISIQINKNRMLEGFVLVGSEMRNQGHLGNAGRGSKLILPDMEEYNTPKVPK